LFEKEFIPSMERVELEKGGEQYENFFEGV
jgi:hypothetical protein